jgi:hypothetical protein
MRAFVIHLGAFLVVNIVLAALNLVRNPQHIWFIWVLAGWGIGLAAHDLALLLERTPRQEAIFRDPEVRGFFVHAFVYLAVNALLIVVNLLAMPNQYWFYWPLIGWGLGLAAHGYVVFHGRKAAGTQPRKSRAKAGVRK